MKLWTYQEIEDKVRRDLDMQDTVFITEEEMVGIANSAIDEAEQMVLKINEDYFLRQTTLNLVNGSADVALPSDIYANKIKGLVYHNGSIIYPVKRLKSIQKFLDAEHINEFSNNTADYQYIITSPTAGQPGVITLFPVPYESGAFLKCWYLRNAQRIPQLGEGGANRATQLATVVDIPEAVNFIVACMKVSCLEKEKEQGNQSYAAAVAKLEKERQLLVDTLTEQTVDDSNEIVMDLSHYTEHS